MISRCIGRNEWLPNVLLFCSNSADVQGNALDLNSALGSCSGTAVVSVGDAMRTSSEVGEVRLLVYEVEAEGMGRGGKDVEVEYVGGAPR